MFFIGIRRSLLRGRMLAGRFAPATRPPLPLATLLLLASGPHYPSLWLTHRPWQPRQLRASTPRVHQMLCAVRSPLFPQPLCPPQCKRWRPS
ncbi:hypothetical protein GGF41_001583 [Coemansia sp. RSA 2531]|nr:hypothetical protein GGF41_001583 [Coemansia sp. RSA 2531]